MGEGGHCPPSPTMAPFMAKDMAKKMAMPSQLMMIMDNNEIHEVWFTFQVSFANGV